LSTRTLSRARAYRRTPQWVFWLRRIALATVAIVAVATTWSLVSALRAPGTDDVPTRLAEWGRDHAMGPLVTLAETVQYKMSPPATGGTPDTTLLTQAAAADNGSSSPSSATGQSIAPQAAVVPPVSPALAGEGHYVHAVLTADGPAIQIAYVRPDHVHTSFLTGIAWMSHTLHFVLHPGFEDPGTSGMSQPDSIKPPAYPGLLATFNSGFKLKDANGGYYDHGHYASPLVKGAASFVIYKDGHATVGIWGSNTHMSSDVAFVRQNLQPLITNGKIASNLSANVQSNWGATIGGAYYVWRSGIGVSASGDLIYVMGDALSVSSLADILHLAGAVTAMQLDINKLWASYMYYKHPTATSVQPHKMGNFARPADRYLQETSRDFIAVYDPKLAN